MMAAAKKDPAWPNCPTAHLMVAYLKEAFDDATALSWGKQDLEACVMKKDENPKVCLAGCLLCMQFAGNHHLR
jgi:hypothetical protein